MQHEIFDKPVQFSGCGSAATSQQGAVSPDLEILAEMVELASSGCLVFWPAGLNLAAAKALLAGPAGATCSQASTAAAPEDPEVVLSSQELEHELEALLTLEGWV